MAYKNPFGITKEMVLEILRETSRIMSNFKRGYLDKYDAKIGNKLKSELVGKIIEITAMRVFSKHLGQVDRALTDTQPDLRFTKIPDSRWGGRPLEVKVTSTLNTWQGGAFSKRPSDYLLISWGGNFDEFFAAIAHIDESEWDLTSFKKGKRYGPLFKVKQLYEKEDKEVFVGSFNVTPRSVKLIRENV